MTRLLLVVAVLAVLVAVRPVLAARRRRETDAALPTLRLGEFVTAPADRTWVVFTTPYCATCGPVTDELRRVFPDDGVVSVDATERPDLVDRLGVRRSPTVFEIDADGRIVDRLIGADQARTRMAASAADDAAVR